MQFHLLLLNSPAEKNIKIFFLFIFLPLLIHSQNLVPNPGFENFTTCPVGFSQFNGYVSNWVNPSAATPDYMNSCANPFPAGVPQNGTGYQVTHGGNAYAGFYSGTDTYHEYVQIQLTSPLVAGNNYSFKMFVVIHNKSKTATDDIGAYFSVTAPASAGSAFLNGNPVAQITNTPGNVLTDSSNWTMISGNFTASGGERYLTIGHFKPDAASNYLTINYGGQGAYYYVDDVSLFGGAPLPVELISLIATLQKNKSQQNEILVKWITASEENNCCFEIEQSRDGIAFNAIGKVEGNKNSSTLKEYSFTDIHPFPGINYYRLKQFDWNNDIEYSKTVSVKNGDKDISIYLIEEDNNLIIHFLNRLNENVTLEIFNASGQTVFQKERFVAGENNRINISGFKKGIYFLRLREHAGSIYSFKFICN